MSWLSLEIAFVMPGLVPGIHVFPDCNEDVDGRAKPGHDGNRDFRGGLLAQFPSLLNAASATFSGVMPKWR
jgi:hypothetical protein